MCAGLVHCRCESSVRGVPLPCADDRQGMPRSKAVCRRLDQSAELQARGTRVSSDTHLNLSILFHFPRLAHHLRHLSFRILAPWLRRTQQISSLSKGNILFQKMTRPCFANCSLHGRKTGMGNGPYIPCEVILPPKQLEKLVASADTFLTHTSIEPKHIRKAIAWDLAVDSDISEARDTTACRRPTPETRRTPQPASVSTSRTFTPTPLRLPLSSPYPTPGPSDSHLSG
jgi:hypothetical protein